MTNSLYSIAICPPREIVEAVREMKIHLANEAGKYSSWASDAHITFNVFEGDEKTLKIWTDYVKLFCQAKIPTEVYFSETGIFENAQAYYLAPDDASKKYLKELMSKFHRHAPIQLESISKEPHITIGRRLKDDQLEVAKRLFNKRRISLRFVCDGISLRKFDPDKKQYFVAEQFPFVYNQDLQTSLF